MSEPEDLILEGAHSATRLARDAVAASRAVAAISGAQLASIRTGWNVRARRSSPRRFRSRAIEPPPRRPGSHGSRLDGRRAAPLGGLRNGRTRVYLRRCPRREGQRGRHRWPCTGCWRCEQSARIVRQLTAHVRAVCGRRTDSRSVPDRRCRDRRSVDGGERAWPLPEILASARVGRAGRARRSAPEAAASTLVERAVCRPSQLRSTECHTCPCPTTHRQSSAPDGRTAMAGSYATTGRYHPIAPVLLLGRASGALRTPAERRGMAGLTIVAAGEAAAAHRGDAPPPPARDMRRTTKTIPATGAWVIRADEPQESVEDPFGLQRPADREQDADPEGLGDSLSELPEARVVRTPRTAARSAAERRTSRPSGAHAGSEPSAATDGVSYPEWDCRTNTIASQARSFGTADAHARRRGMGDRVPGAACEARATRPHAASSGFDRGRSGCSGR